MKPVQTNQNGNGGMNSNMNSGPVGKDNGSHVCDPNGNCCSYKKRLWILVGVFVLICLLSLCYVKAYLDTDSYDDRYMSGRMMDQNRMQNNNANGPTPATSTDTTDIKQATSADASVDAFMKDSESMPDGSEFNDDYSDMNQ